MAGFYFNVKNYTVYGDGAHDDTAMIQAVLNMAANYPGSVVFFPPGIYLISATLTIPGNIALLGCSDADGGTVIQMKSGTALTTPILASADWYNNSTTCGSPIVIKDIKIDGNSATSGSNAHGLVLMNYWSIVERCSITNVAGDGFHFTAFNKSGSHITNTCVEPKISKLQVRNVGGVGIHVHDDGTTLNSCTDGFLEDCIVQNAGTLGISVEMAPGWLVSGNHVYGTGQTSIYLQRCYSTRCIGNYIDGYGSGTATYIAGIAMDCIDGRGSVCASNVIGFEHGTATGPYQALTIMGKGSNRTVCTVTNNTINGGSQSGSLGLVYMAQGSQIGHPFVVYSFNNDTNNVALTSYVDSNTTVNPGNTFINVKDFGATGNGSTDDTTAIQTALTLAGTISGSIVYFPTGIYIVSATLTYPGNTELLGSGDNDSGTILRVKSGVALTTPVLASTDWYNNATTSGNPVIIRDIKIDGNSATSGTAAHGIVSMNYWSIFERISISTVSGDGFLLTASNQAGTHISNTCVEAKISRLQVRSAGQCGIHVKDSGSPLNSCTDGFLQDCIVQSSGTNAINIEMGAGWLVSGNHIYGTGTSAIVVSKCYATRIIGNYVDGFGSGTATFIAGIDLTLIDGRGSSCIGNHVGFESGAATGPYRGIRVTGSGSATTVCTIANNTVNGGSQSSSQGYNISTNGSQNGHPWIVYFNNNDAQNVATFSSFDNTNAQAGNTQVFGHIVSIGPSTTATAGSNAGTSPPSPVISGTDLDGQVTFGTGTSPSAGQQVTVSFAKSYTNPRVVITPINSASASLNFYVSVTSTTFTVSSVNAPSASQSNTVYGFNYHVLA